MESTDPIVVTPVSPGTTTGVARSVKDPSPSWPCSLLPQHLTVPPGTSPHEWMDPAATDVYVGAAGAGAACAGAAATRAAPTQRGQRPRHQCRAYYAYSCVVRAK